MIFAVNIREFKIQFIPYSAIFCLLQIFCVSSHGAQHHSEWDTSSSGLELLFDLDVATSMLFVDGEGPSDQFYLDVDSGQMHAESLRVFYHPKVLLYTAVRFDLYNEGTDAWLLTLKHQRKKVSSTTYSYCWHATNTTTRLLQAGGVQHDQVKEASFIGCYVLPLNFEGLVGEDFQVMPKNECLLKYADLDICNTHTIIVWGLAPVEDNCAPVVSQEHDDGSMFLKLQLGAIYIMKFHFSFKILQDDASVVTVEKDGASLVVFRNKINFVYLIQHDGFCNFSHLRHSDAEALVIQWKEEQDCDGCFFFPNSTQNEGRNELWYRTFEKWPGTVFTYYIFLDGDTNLIFRPDRNKLSPLPNSSSLSLPFLVFEQHLLHYRPAVAVPFHFNWHVDNGSDVQFLSNFDHIVLAVHANVSRMFLPTETMFDHMSWWWAQRIWGFLCTVAFPQQTLQFNAVMSDNGSSKQLSMTSLAVAQVASKCCGFMDTSNLSFVTKNPDNSAPEGSKKYIRNNYFEQAFLWFMSSVQKGIASVLPDITNLYQSQPNSRAQLQPVKSDGIFNMATLSEFTKTFDCSHPYWLNHRFVLVTNRTFTGFMSACIYFSDVGKTSKESCDRANSELHLVSKITSEMLILKMNIKQILLEQNLAIARKMCEVMHGQICVSDPIFLKTFSAHVNDVFFEYYFHHAEPKELFEFALTALYERQMTITGKSFNDTSS